MLTVLGSLQHITKRLLESRPLHLEEASMVPYRVIGGMDWVMSGALLCFLLHICSAWHESLLCMPPLHCWQTRRTWHCGAFLKCETAQFSEGMFAT